ncbi:hypothetical protein LI012_10430 [Caldibacillus thermoamylovorans]|nr:hypothetical protein [Caldibacillus thermoamylovorans]MCB5935769.1 hypothetical protein [Bacillus sp. DFI.2.34]MCB7077232.1 hypothetical protein [Caldibacillus thermoamylovorans]
MQRRAFMMSTKQVLSSPVFYLSILAVTALSFFSVWNDLTETVGKGGSVVYFFELFLGLTMFKKLTVLFAALPYVSSFCSDWKYQYIKPVVIRTGVKRYTWSKIFTCFLSGLLTVFCGLLLFLFILSLKMPLFPTEHIENIVGPPYSPLIEGNFPILYLILKSFVFSMAAALWAVVGLTVSAFIPSHFVAIATPVIASYVLEELTSIFPKWLNLYRLTRSADVLQQGPLVSFLYFCFIFLLFAVLAGFLFDYQVRRRIRNEVV